MIGAHVAPCGHPGECIIGNFVRCLQSCGSRAPSREAESRESWTDALTGIGSSYSAEMRRLQALRSTTYGNTDPPVLQSVSIPAGLARHPGETDGQLRQRAKPFNFGTHGVSIGYSTPAVDVSPDGTLLPTPPALDAVHGMEEWVTARRQWRSHILAYYPKHVFYTDGI